MSTYTRWILANAWAEALGLGLAAGVLALAIGSDAPLPITLVLAAVAGVLEGVVVALAQRGVVRDALPAVSSVRWLAMTVLGSVVVWVLATLAFALAAPSGSMADGTDPGLLLQLAVAAPLGAVAGPVLGGWQAVALADAVDRPARWVVANSAAWALGMPVVFLGAASVPAGASVAEVAVVAAVVAVLAGLVVGAVHGRWLVAFARESREDRATDPTRSVVTRIPSGRRAVDEGQSSPDASRSRTSAARARTSATSDSRSRLA